MSRFIPRLKPVGFHAPVLFCKGTIGFALTILQRRLASSPEAIYQSLRRRRERLQKRLREEEVLKQGLFQSLIEIYAKQPPHTIDTIPHSLLQSVFDSIENRYNPEDWEDDFDDISGEEREATEEEVVDQATAARTIAELQAEITQLEELEQLAFRVRRSGNDKKWEELSKLLQNEAELFDAHGHRRKLVIFTEHRDTLNYLADRIRMLLGRPELVVTIHGGMVREERKKAEESFKQDRSVGTGTPCHRRSWGGD